MSQELSGRCAVVTGASSGIGLETAKGLARRGATVTLVGRDAARVDAARLAVARVATGEPPGLALADMGSLAQVRELAATLLERHQRLDLLVNNAGALNATRKTSADGLELTFAVNHLAPYLLTRRLLPALQSAGRARVVTVASEAHRMAPLDFDDLQAERDYAPLTVYGRSKLCNVLFARELARRLNGSGVTSNSLHPGVVATGFARNDPGWYRLAWTLLGPFLATPEKGARTSLLVATSPALVGVTGQYFKGDREVAPSAAAQDAAAAARLWELSAQLAALPV